MADALAGSRPTTPRLPESIPPDQLTTVDRQRSLPALLHAIFEVHTLLLQAVGVDVDDTGEGDGAGGK